MNLNNESFKKQVVPIVIYLFVSFLFVSLSIIHFFDPFYVLTDKLTAGVRSNLYAAGIAFEHYLGGFSNVNTLVGENTSLKNKLHDLQSIEADNARLQSENNALRDQLGIALPTKKKLLFSLIISRDTILDSVVIDKGSDDGVTKDDLLVYKNILLGQVTDVLPQTAKVQLVTSKDASIPVEVANTPVEGVLQSSLNGVTMTDILPEETVNTGNMVVTSGLGGIFPKGLLIGTVTSVQPVSSQPFKNASIQLSYDINDTSYAFILQK